MELEAHIRHLYGPEVVPYELDELVVVCLVRDGRTYVRSFVEHYFSLGAKHLVFMDNGSTDGTVETLKTYDNVTVLSTDLPFKEQKNPLRRYLIERFGSGRWVLYVDIDEFFDYPYSEVVGLGSFLRYLTSKFYTAVVAQMLDMFPKSPVAGAAAGQDDELLREHHRFYDISGITRQGYYSRGDAHNKVGSEEIEVHRDGINRAIFGQRALLTKHPLMFLDGRLEPVSPGPHWVSGASVADVTGVLYHYKFAGHFYEKTVRAVREGNYVNDSQKYKKFLSALERDPHLRIEPEGARELKGTEELVDEQFLVVSADYMAWVDAEERKDLSGGEGASGSGEPCRLAEAFEKANAKARTGAREIRVLSRQVEILEQRVKEYEGTPKAKMRRRFEQIERRNRDLEHQLKAVHDSWSWQMLSKISLLWSRIRGTKEQR